MFNLKRNFKVYLYNQVNSYRIYTYTDLEVSQSFVETRVKRKTIHQQNSYDSAIINRADAGNFSFTCPYFTNHYHSDLIDYSLNDLNFTLLLVDEEGKSFILEKCVVDNCIFQFGKDILLLNISGSFSRVSEYFDTVPEPVIDIFNESKYFIPFDLNISVNSIPIDFITNFSIEIKKDISWLNNGTLHTNPYVSGVSQTIYKDAYVVNRRDITGNIEHVLKNTDTLVDWDNSASFNISVKNKNNDEIAFVMPSVVYTKRNNFGNILTSSLDFRVTNSDFILTY